MKNKYILANLITRMKHDGISQAQLGEEIGLSQTVISQRLNCEYEKAGQFSNHQKVLIAKFLKVKGKEEREELFKEFEINYRSV